MPEPHPGGGGAGPRGDGPHPPARLHALTSRVPCRLPPSGPWSPGPPCLCLPEATRPGGGTSWGPTPRGADPWAFGPASSRRRPDSSAPSWVQGSPGPCVWGAGLPKYGTSSGREKQQWRHRGGDTGGRGGAETLEGGFSTAATCSKEGHSSRQPNQHPSPRLPPPPAPAQPPPWGSRTRPHPCPTSACVLRMWYLTPLSELNSLGHSRQQYFPTRWSPCRHRAVPRTQVGHHPWPVEVKRGPAAARSSHHPAPRLCGYRVRGNCSLSGWMPTSWASGTQPLPQGRGGQGREGRPLLRAPAPSPGGCAPRVAAETRRTWRQDCPGLTDRGWVGHQPRRSKGTDPMCGNPWGAAGGSREQQAHALPQGRTWD